MAVFGLRKLLKNLIKFQSFGWNDEKAPPPTPVAVGSCQQLRAAVWDVEGVAAARSLPPCGVPYGMVVRTRREAAAGVCNIIYLQ